jgi:L-fuconolactonase
MTPPLNRRHFLATAATMALTGCSSSFSRRTNALSSPSKLSIIDSHTHFYDPNRPQGVPWPPSNDKLLYRTVLPRDFRALSLPQPVTGTVVVEASPWIEDNQWVLNLAAENPFILGFVGNLPAGTKQFEPNLKRFAANKTFRGIRLGEDKLENFQNNPPILSDLKLLAAHNLSLDLLGGEGILSLADQLSTTLPTLRIIIDHLAGLTVDGNPPPLQWLQKMQKLAPRPNIYFKLSGLVEGTHRADGTAPHDPAFYAPVLNAMCNIFAPERLIYASNWPVCELFAPIATVENIILDYFRSRPPAEFEQVFSLSSRRAYNLL